MSMTKFPGYTTHYFLKTMAHPFTFEPLNKNFLNSFGVSAKIAQSKVQQRVFGVHSTPTLVINGKYRVSFGKHAKGDPLKLFEIVETLAAQ